MEASVRDEFFVKFKERLLYEGLCEVGFSRIDETVPPDLSRYHYAVTLMYRPSNAISTAHPPMPIFSITAPSMPCSTGAR